MKTLAFFTFLNLAFVSKRRFCLFLHTCVTLQCLVQLWRLHLNCAVFRQSQLGEGGGVVYLAGSDHGVVKDV